MWNGEDSYNKQLVEHSNLTYCLNVSLMVHEKDLSQPIGYITNEILEWALQMAHLSQKGAPIIFSTFDPFFIVHENDQFWYMAINMEYEILKWAPKITQLSSNELVTFFSSFWSHFIRSAVKLSILMCHTWYFLWNFKMSSQTISIKP